MAKQTMAQKKALGHFMIDQKPLGIKYQCPCQEPTKTGYFFMGAGVTLVIVAVFMGFIL